MADIGYQSTQQHSFERAHFQPVGFGAIKQVYEDWEEAFDLMSGGFNQEAMESIMRYAPGIGDIVVRLLWFNWLRGETPAIHEATTKDVTGEDLPETRPDPWGVDVDDRNLYNLSDDEELRVLIASNLNVDSIERFVAKEFGPLNPEMSQEVISILLDENIMMPDDKEGNDAMIRGMIEEIGLDLDRLYTAFGEQSDSPRLLGQPDYGTSSRNVGGLLGGKPVEHQYAQEPIKYGERPTAPIDDIYSQRSIPSDISVKLADRLVPKE